MSTDTSKIRSRVAKLDKSLDELESQLEPLFAQSLPETLLALDPIQQAKLQVIIPYVVYDLVFVYLKSRGIDPKTHRVVTELERVRQYFDKIKHAEESDERQRLGIDKAAAGRFIKHAIAQAKNAKLVDEDNDEPSGLAIVASSSSSERVPVKVTSKMVARAEYEKDLDELGDEEDLDVFDEEMAVQDEEPMDISDDSLEETRFTSLDKGKGRASEGEQFKDEGVPSEFMKPRVDPFAGYENLLVSGSIDQMTDYNRKLKRSPPVHSSSEDRGTGRAARKAKCKARKQENS